MKPMNWAEELSTPDAVGVLAVIRRRDHGMPPWEDAAALFQNQDAQGWQDRILRALVNAYKTPDLRAGPIIIALLWRRICARCNGDDEAVQSLVVAVLEVCRLYEHIDQSGLPLRLVNAGWERQRSRLPVIHTVPLADLIPDRDHKDDDEDRGLLTPKEAAARLKLKTTDTLARWAKEGLIKAIRTPTGRYRYSEAEVERIKNQAAV